VIERYVLVITECDELVYAIFIFAKGAGLPCVPDCALQLESQWLGDVFWAWSGRLDDTTIMVVPGC
jgi:hypothetical protein